MRPLISIIVPIYNAEKDLHRCLDSLINQYYKRIEVILVDDGSIDSSPEICDDYAQKDSRVKVIHKHNEGVSEARNIGLGVAKGDYIHFTDADDWVEISIFERLIEIANKYQDCDIIRFNAFNSSNTIVNEIPYQGEYIDSNLDEIVLNYIGAAKFGGMFILGVPWMYLFRKQLLDKAYIRFNKNLRRCEDRLFTLTSLLHSNKVVFIDDVLYHYETNTNSLSNRYDASRWEQECLFLSQLKNEYIYIKDNSFIKEANARIKNEYILRAIVSIDNEFYSENSNNFLKRYSNTKTIVNNFHVKESSVNLQTERLGYKDKLILFMIKHKLSLLLSLMNMIIFYKNKING